ncbi:alpha/beta hydrolase [Streptomyces sp. A1547]|uniref:alpha/beta hydrolase n=1 Tax=Streptomyces sp. A1547 TaxID=2563105 RepID=UPI00109E4D55|nr:alpha/beta hydrolase [Streptomyces sp. A1547]THA37624.1 alpha/beta hydrolase [Streptomyces sp. A1547]
MKRLAPMLAAAGLIATTIPLLSATGAVAATTAEYTPQKPAWQRCSTDQPASYECATLKVPLDYRRPQGATIDLAISRMKSENPAKRHGAMLLNPGGPGGSGLDLPLMMNEVMPKDVRDQYDLIGFDPRGVGASSPITCGLTDAEQNIDRPYKEETFQADVTWAHTVAEKCREKAGSVLPFITTRNTARDMDAIRSALGEKKISYVGYSYGTYLGAVYTQMFPNRSDRFVLDSGVDPQRAWRGMIQVWATEAEPAFVRWTQWTAERAAEFQLGDTPDAVSRTFWDLVARADKQPIEFDGIKLTGDDIRTARGVFFYPSQAAPLVRALKDAADGKPVKPAAPQLKWLKPSAAPASDNGTAVFLAVVCGDTEWPRYPEQYAREAAKDKAKYPLYGDFASNIKPCSDWRRPIEPATPMKTKTDVLTVQNEWDSQTPLVSGQGLHKALKGSRMVLAMGGEGHGVYLVDPNSCANATVNSYLTTGKLPAQDVTCRTTPGSAERRSEIAPQSPQRFPVLSDRRF